MSQCLNKSMNLMSIKGNYKSILEYLMRHWGENTCWKKSMSCFWAHFFKENLHLHLTWIQQMKLEHLILWEHLFYQLMNKQIELILIWQLPLTKEIGLRWTSPVNIWCTLCVHSVNKNDCSRTIHQVYTTSTRIVHFSENKWPPAYFFWSTPDIHHR